MEALGQVKKSLAKTIFCLSLHYNHDNNYLFLNENGIRKLKR